MKFVNKLEKQRVLIFGATSGIGYAIAEACIEYNAHVIISGSNEERLQQTVQKLESSYPGCSDRVATAQVDLSNADKLDDNIKQMFETVTSSGAEKINHIAFTAGDQLAVAQVGDITMPKLLQIPNVRLFAPIMIAKHIKTYMVDGPDSSFTITGGVNTDKPMPGWALIAAFGGACVGLVKGLAVDLAPIRVNCVEPGAIKTPLLGSITPEMERMFIEKTKVGRLGRPEDTAEAYLYSMKDGFVTAEVIKTNGGYLLC